MKGNACERLGIISKKVVLETSTSTEELIAAIQELNEDPNVHGILSDPVPHHIDERAAFDAIAIEKTWME